MATDFQDALAQKLGTSTAGNKPVAVGKGPTYVPRQQLADEAIRRNELKTERLGNTFFGGPGSSSLDDSEGPFNRFKQASGDLAQRLGRVFQFSNMDTRMDEASDLLLSEGAEDPRIGNQERLDIERQRQAAAQTMAGQPGQGNPAASVREQLLAMGAAQRQTEGALDRINRQEARQRADIGSIFRDLFLQPSLALAAGNRALEPVRQEGPDNMTKFLGAAGSILGGLRWNDTSQSGGNVGGSVGTPIGNDRYGV